jgi:uncharacterized protein
VVVQAIEPMSGVTVFGSALLRTEPDLAEVDLGVVNKAETAAEAFEANRAGVGAVRDSLRASGLADDSVEVARVTLETLFDSYGRRDVASHKAYVHVRFLMTRLDEVEATLTAAVEAGANQVQVTYQTSRLRELRAQARQNAIRAARAKAENYCEAAEVQLGQVVYIEDLNPQYVSSGMHDLGLRSNIPEDEEPVVAGVMESGSLIVKAAVRVGYTLLQH